MHHVKDEFGNLTSIVANITMIDDASAESSEQVCIQGDELASLPAPGAGRKAAIKAIIKRETHMKWNGWKARVPPIAPVPQDPAEESGVTEFVNFNGEALPYVPPPPPPPIP